MRRKPRQLVSAGCAHLKEASSDDVSLETRRPMMNVVNNLVQLHKTQYRSVG